MLETKGGKIVLLLLMVAVTIYTTINYINGRAEFLLLCFCVMLLLTTGTRIIQSLIDDFRNS